ncbi:MAG: DNA-3-methyladenine glycosylase 2 family protein [Chloroflexota bacterium]|nr:DNA-3-methyladenine glycosylase 2 family protein [Chloroflexota bacterium]|tara:strand:+ start:17654 stop:18265 length:612 start_codon:yes stop_codon:yes gene_type:complete
MKPKYWDKAIKELSSKDPILKKIIGNHKNEYLIPSNDPFNTLVNSIIGQQISTHAAKSIKMKLEKLTKINPKGILSKKSNELRKCGLSSMKVKYLVDISERVENKITDFYNISNLEDEEAKSELMKIKGIGPWTAEMFLIFYLARPNILPRGDIGIINSLINLYGENNKDSINFEKFYIKWSPWNSVASWFLWRNIDDTNVSY